MRSVSVSRDNVINKLGWFVIGELNAKLKATCQFLSSADHRFCKHFANSQRYLHFS